MWTVSPFWTIKVYFWVKPIKSLASDARIFFFFEKNFFCQNYQTLHSNPRLPIKDLSSYPSARTNNFLLWSDITMIPRDISWHYEITTFKCFTLLWNYYLCRNFLNANIVKFNYMLFYTTPSIISVQTYIKTLREQYILNC